MKYDVDTNKNVKKKANPTFNIEKLAKEDNGKAISLIHSIVNHFSTITSEPLFVNNGEKIRIDTRDGSYMERIK